MNATPERMTASVLEHILFKGNEELVFTENIMMALEKQVLNLEHADDISSEVVVNIDKNHEICQKMAYLYFLIKKIKKIHFKTR